MLGYLFMKATLLLQRKFTLTCTNGKAIAVFMDVFRLPDGYPDSFPEGYRFSWIAYDSEDESARVLFDCHHPKGPHIHLDVDPTGTPFEWKSLESAYDLFFQKLRERFGDFESNEEQ